MEPGAMQEQVMRRRGPRPGRGERAAPRSWPALATTLGVALAGAAAGSLSRTRRSRRPFPGFFRVGGPALAVIALGYHALLRRRQLAWGAMPAELRRPMPGDELVPHPHAETTRALTIEVPPVEVWAWLVQLGYRRGGWYSYDWLDNLGRPSARRVIPELQRLEVGEALAPGKTPFTVAALEPGRFLVVRGRNRKGRTSMSWTFLIEPLGPRRSRLIERIRIRFDLSPGGIFWAIVFEPADFVMMRKQLLTLKRRAEGGAAVRAP